MQSILLVFLYFVIRSVGWQEYAILRAYNGLQSSATFGCRRRHRRHHLRIYRRDGRLHRHDRDHHLYVSRIDIKSCEQNTPSREEIHWLPLETYNDHHQGLFDEK